MILTKLYSKKRYITALLLLFIAAIAIAGPYSGKLADVQTNDNLQFLPESAEATKVAKIQAASQASGEIPALILITETNQQTLNPKNIPTITKNINEQTNKIKHVSTVTGPIPSEDQKALLYVASINTDDTEQTVETLQKLQNLPPPATGTQVDIAGPAAFLADLTEAFEGIDGLLLLVALAVVALILIIVYKSPFLPIIVLFTSISALAVASLAVYEMAASDWITLNGQAQGILFILVVGATTDYSLLLIARMRENLAEGQQKTVAALTSLKQVAEPIIASAATVAAAVLVLGLSDLKANAALGPVAAVGIVSSALLVLGMLPAILALGGRKLYWPKKPVQQNGGYWARVGQKVAANPRKAWLIPTLILTALIPLGLIMPATGVPTSAFFTTETSSHVANDRLAQHYPAELGSETIIIQPAGENNNATETKIENTTGVAQVKQGQPITTNGQTWTVWTVTLTDNADSDKAEQTIKTLRNNLPEDALVGGSTAVTVDSNTISFKDATLIMPLILLVILLILIGLLRSIIGPLVLIGSVVISFGATYALGVLLFKALGHPGIDPSVPLFSFVFLAALGVDYNIFLTTRAKEETRKTQSAQRGIITALAATGAVITSAGLVLAATFAALAVLPLLFLFQIAFLVSFGVLLDTFVVRTLIVPGAFYELNWRAWWPGKLAAISKNKQQNTNN